jgi:peptidoglycan/LPS O-acetylase OafA/YrhL
LGGTLRAMIRRTRPRVSSATLVPDTAGRERSRPRIIALDLIRVLIIAFVVAVHTLAIGGGEVTLALGAFIIVFHTSRELFFLLTTLVLTYNYGHRRQVRWLAFWRRRYSLVVPAYAVWSLIYFLADGERLDPFSAALIAFGHDLLTGDARYQLYFLLVTMQVYLAFPLLRWLLRKTSGHHLALFLAVCAYQLALTFAMYYHPVTHGPVAVLVRTAGSGSLLPAYLLYVVGGAMAGWHFDSLAAFTRRHASAASVALVAGAGVCAGLGSYFTGIIVGGEGPGTASAVFQPVVVIETLAFAWALLAAGLLWADTGARHGRLIAAGGDCSFGIYLAHPLVLQGTLLLAGAAGVLTAIRDGPAAVELAALLGVGVPVVYGVSWALVFLVRRTPLSLVLTGRQRQKSRITGPGDVTSPASRPPAGAAFPASAASPGPSASGIRTSGAG